ncbi:hypothetical protein B566_EDAN012338 [Ephemera danica]|nr:hypothetical protein B566_EDAN012338 [Ephemera danica]
MYVTPILLLLLASNVFTNGSEDWQALFSNMGINTKETSCVVQNFKVNLDTLMSLANKQQNEISVDSTLESQLYDDCYICPTTLSKHLLDWFHEVINYIYNIFAHKE